MINDNADIFRKMAFLVVASAVVLTGCGGGGGGGSSDSSSGGSGGASGSASISGTISIASGTRVDSDYADLWAANGGSFPDGRGAVVMPVPGVAGGFLSDAAGEYGNGLTVPEDTSDTYSVEVQNGDRYMLQCFPSTKGVDVSELGVSLTLNNEPFPGNACGSRGIIETTEPSSIIEISASAGGPFRYVLTVAPQWALLSLDASWPEPDLMVNEAIVTGTPAVTSALSSSGVRASSMMDQVRSIGPDTYHVQRSSTMQALSASVASASTASTDDPRAQTIDWIRGLREDFGLQAEPNYVVRQSTTSPGSNPYYVSAPDGLPHSWNLDLINMEPAWGLAGGRWGEGVGIAVMDTGMFSSTPSTYGNWHEDLVGNVVPESAEDLLDFVSAKYDTDVDTGRDTNPATPFNNDNPEGGSYHGTHVAGIIAALDNNLGTVGIAHEATILPYRVLGTNLETGEEGVGSSADLIESITSAANRSDVVDVINLSLGGLPRLDALQDATNLAYENNILVVAAGGNNADSSAIYPAANQKVLGVGAVNRKGELSSFSNYGQSVDLLAPGGERGDPSDGVVDPSDGIVNAYGPKTINGKTYNYAYLSGTSMAAPHVSGVYALMKSINPNLTPNQFRAQLIAGELTNDALDNYPLYGAGLLDAARALENPNSFPTVVSAWPRVLELDPSGQTGTVLLEILTPDSGPMPSLNGVTTYPDEVVVTDGSGNPVPSSGPIPASLKVSVDPEKVTADRQVVASVVIPYTDGTVNRNLEIPVYVRSQDPVEERDAGRHYALLVDANDPNSARSQQTPASYSNGSYSYSFADVAPGDYYLYAGSDLDNNGLICENGEACAEYPHNGAPEVITVRDGDSEQLDMTTSFGRPTLAEMGLPRYGFRGYPLLEHPDRAQ